MEENAPPSLRSNSCIWSLIVGSEASSWAGLLLHEHLAPAARLALFRTCKASRDMVLSTAKHVTVTLALVMGDPAHEFKRIRALRRALKTRAMQTTRFRFKLMCVELWPLTQAISVLELEGQRLQEMEVQYPAGTLPVSIVTEIGCCYPNLKYLAIRSKLEAMPGSELFPQLQELHICPAGMTGANLERLYRTTQPYLPRLTRLAVTQPDPLARFTHLPLLLSPSPLPGLRSLELATMLDDDLLGLLLQCAPTLETLAVQLVILESTMHAQATCGWQHLGAGGVFLSSLARLPLPTGMVVTAKGIVCDIITDEAQAALQAAMAKVHPGIRTHAGKRGMWLEPESELQTDLQPAALRGALNMLRTRLDDPPSSMWLGLRGWSITARLIRELQGLPHWDSLTLGGTWVAGHSCMYTTLLRSLPTSFNTVSLSVDAPTIEAICWGAPIDRTAERPFHIKLLGDRSRIQAVRAALQLSEALPHVIISPFY